MPIAPRSDKADDRSRGRGTRRVMAFFSSWVLPSKSSSPSRSTKPRHGRTPTSSSEGSSGSTAGSGGRGRAGSGVDPSTRMPPLLPKAPATIASRAGRAEPVPLNSAFYNPEYSSTHKRPSTANGYRRPLPPGLSASPHAPYDIPRRSLDSRPGTSESRHFDPSPPLPANRAPPFLASADPIYPARHAKSQSELATAAAAAGQQTPPAVHTIPRKAPPPYLPNPLDVPTRAASNDPPLVVVRPGGASGGRPGSAGRGASGGRPGSAGRDGPRPSLPIGPISQPIPISQPMAISQPRLRPEMHHKKSHSTVHECEVADELPPLPASQHLLPMPHREGLHPRPRTSSRLDGMDVPTKPRSKRKHLAVRPATADNADIGRKKQSWRGQWNVEDIEEVRKRLRELR
ncbi:hypothetical protein HDZ31DRAFT_44491 [Schizophyllum fasciatum]